MKLKNTIITILIEVLLFMRTFIRTEWLWGRKLIKTVKSNLKDTKWKVYEEVIYCIRNIQKYTCNFDKAIALAMPIISFHPHKRFFPGYRTFLSPIWSSITVDLQCYWQLFSFTKFKRQFHYLLISIVAVGKLSTLLQILLKIICVFVSSFFCDAFCL